MKKLWLLVFCVLVYHLGIAQERPINQEPKFEYQGLDLKSFLYRKIKYPPQFFRQMETAIAFARFKVSKEGRIDTVFVSRGTDESVRLEITNVLKKTNGYWTPKIRNSQPVESSTYLLPVQFKIENRSRDRYNLEENFSEALDQFPNLFDFQDGSKQSVSQFIILDPIVFFGTTPMH